MNEEDTTEGLPSSDLFDLTAPNNEYLTNSYTIFTTDASKFSLKKFQKDQGSLDNTDVVSPNRTEGFSDSHELEINKSESYIKYISSDQLLLRFSNILEAFLLNYFRMSEIKIKECLFSIFTFPGEDYEEPMIEIIFPKQEDFNNLEVKDDIEEKFKRVLVKNSKDFEEFKTFRKVQKKFRFVIERE
jgi:hypothetical protein